MGLVALTHWPESVPTDEVADGSRSGQLPFAELTVSRTYQKFDERATCWQTRAEATSSMPRVGSPCTYRLISSTRVRPRPDLPFRPGSTDRPHHPRMGQSSSNVSRLSRSQLEDPRTRWNNLLLYSICYPFLRQLSFATPFTNK